MIPKSEGTCSVKASHNLARVSVSFDDDKLLPNGGLAVAGVLAQKLGVAELVDAHVTLSGDGAGNSGAKALTVIGSALAGGDCIDDVDVLRAGAAPQLFDGVRAPSTVGTWLRLFVWATVRQLDRVTRELLARAWGAGLGPDLDADLTIDIDSTVCETYGLNKQGGQRFSYLGVRGYHPLIASLADTGELLHTRLRGGNAASGRGAASFVAETISRVRDAGARGGLTLRADSGFYAGAVVSACRRAGVAFSVTVRKNTAVRRAIDAIPDQAWTPIPYWIDGGADVAETTYTAFAGSEHEITCRLLVRRVRPTPGSQLAMDVVFDYHAILTDRDGDLLSVEADHRRHAVVEHVIADLKHHAGLAHLPSGKFAANAAWLTLVGVAYNLARWTAHAAGLGRVTTKTLRLTIIAVPARLVRRSRRLRLRMPTGWPWADAIRDALAAFARIAAPG
ncbi:MAG: IS1380 family transposase [Actinomycetota bacterium]|nr:IS1380 family transposase [Actinomycetota bacterium]